MLAIVFIICVLVVLFTLLTHKLQAKGVTSADRKDSSLIFHLLVIRCVVVCASSYFYAAMLFGGMFHESGQWNLFSVLFSVIFVLTVCALFVKQPIGRWGYIILWGFLLVNQIYGWINEASELRYFFKHFQSNILLGLFALYLYIPKVNKLFVAQGRSVTTLN